MNKFVKHTAFLFFLLFITNESHGENIKIKLVLKWKHQSQFAGFYIAKEKGFYEKQGLDVEFIEGGLRKKALEAVFTGRADFAITSPEQHIISRSQGKDTIAIAAIYRKSAVVFLSKKDSKITSPYDFKGKVIAAKIRDINGGASEFQIQFYAMMEKLGINPKELSLVQYDCRYKGFYNGEVDVTPAYSICGLIKVKNKGLEPNIIWPGNYKIRFYSDILITNETIAKKDPGLVLKFLRASLEGWEFATENIDETIDIVLKYAKKKDKNLQKKMLEASFPLIYTGTDYIGHMSTEIWNKMHKTLVDQKILENPIPDFKSSYSIYFLNKIYEEKLR